MRLPTVLLLVATLFAALAKSTSESPKFDIAKALVDNNNNDDGRGVEENRPSELVPSSILKNASITSHGCTAAVSPPRHASVPFFVMPLSLFLSLLIPCSALPCSKRLVAAKSSGQTKQSTMPPSTIFGLRSSERPNRIACSCLRRRTKWRKWCSWLNATSALLP